MIKDFGLTLKPLCNVKTWI